jgi:hypothetical protein
MRDAGAPAGELALAVGVDANFGERGGRSVAVLLRYLDIVVVAIVAVPAIALGAPTFGYLVGAGGWILQRAVQLGDNRVIDRISEPSTRATARLFEAFGRIFLLAAAIIIAGSVGGRADGLTAALVIFGAYSITFAGRLAAGPPNRSTGP